MLCRAVCGGLRGGLRAVVGRGTPVPATALQARHMSFGIHTSGPNLAFMVLGGGSLTAALFYAYKTVHSDSVRYNHRITDIETRLKSQEEVPADVVTVHAVAEVVESVESATEVAPESSDPGPMVTVDVTLAEEPAAETVVAIATDPLPEVKDTAEDLVSAAVEAAEATVAPVLEVLDAVKVLSSSVAEMAAASVGDGSSSAALVTSSEQAEERRVVLAEGIKLEQAYEDITTSTEETEGRMVPNCHQCSDSHAEHAELEASLAPPAGQEDTSHAWHAEPEDSLAPPTSLEGPETSTFSDGDLENISHAGHVGSEDPIMPSAELEDIMPGEHAEPDASTAPPAGLEDTAALEDTVTDSTVPLEYSEGTRDE